jgi:DNA primase
MKRDKDVLAEALARLEKAGLSQQPPRAVVDETMRRLGAAQAGTAGHESAADGSRGPRRITLARRAFRLLPAAAALIVLGFGIGRLSRPAPLDMDELREALAPSVAAAIEPALREKLIEDLRQRYQVALAAAYVKVKDELTEQYRDDLNRFAVQTLAASNAVMNRQLAEVMENIDTMQAQDLKQVAQVLHQFELNRVQDKTQLAAGLQRLASQTEGELSRTRQQFVQLLATYQPEDLGPEPRPLPNPSERNQP